MPTPLMYEADSFAGARNTIQMLPSSSTECHSCEWLYFNANKCSCSGSALLSVSKHSSNFFLRHFLLHCMQFFVIIVITPESLGERSKSEVNWKITKEKVRTRERLSRLSENSWHLDAVAWGRSSWTELEGRKIKLKTFSLGYSKDSWRYSFRHASLLKNQHL